MKISVKKTHLDHKKSVLTIEKYFTYEMRVLTMKIFVEQKYNLHNTCHVLKNHK
jgi:hypothetical protein